MATIIPTDPQLATALQPCIQSLRRLAGYQLPASLDQKMQDLGERKEFLSPGEHDELLALVEFAQQRTVEKLEAGVALQRLHALFPDLVNAA